MKKSLLSVAALLSATALTLAGCAEPPQAGQTGAAPTTPQATQTDTQSTDKVNKDFKACMVSDSGGFDDKSFNQTSYAGLERAKSDLGVQTAQIESSKVADFPGNIQKMVDQKCKMIITVGFLLGDATMEAAKKNPDVEFAIVDWGAEGMPKNFKSLLFNTAESSFLGGYLAASMSQTGVVGTFGGMKIPTVTIFMDGYAQGVAYFNEKKGKDVKVIGWDVAKQDGQFVGGFEDQNQGKTVATTLTSQGADVIFPVAGPAGLGGLQVALDSGGKVNAIWVDTDGYESNEAKFRPIIASSVVKKMDEAVFDTIKKAAEGSFSSDPYVGTLENEGTGLAPFHDFDGKVSAETKAELDQIKQDIVSGTIKIESAAQPK